MRLSDAFPRFAALEPDIGCWDTKFDWSADLDTVVFDRIWAAQVRAISQLPRFWVLTEALIGDLAEARQRAGNEPARDAIDATRFITCMPALHMTRLAGQLGDCYDWIWTAISPTHDRTKRVNDNVITFAALGYAPAPLQSLYFAYAPNFVATAFYVAYKLGGLDQLTDDIAPAAWRICLRAYHEAPDTTALDAIAQMTIWAATKANQWEQPFVVTLRRLVNRETDKARRKQLMLAFISPPHRLTGLSATDWAERLLTDHANDLVEHERLQVLAVSLRDPTDWRARREEVLQEIAKLRAFYIGQALEGISHLEALELRVGILHPLVYSLTKWGMGADIFDVLGAWYGTPGTAQADANVLVIVPTHNGGAAYIWPQGMLLTGDGTTTTHDAIQRAASVALGTYYRGQDGDHDPESYNEVRFDVPQPKAGGAFEAAIAAHYQFERLGAALPAGWRPRSVVVFPDGPEPVQALLAQRLNIAAPIEISFRRPGPMRVVRRLSVWAAGVMHEDFELEAIRHVAERSGWELAVHQHAAPTAELFRAFYEDEAADLLWVISHGEYDPFRINGSGIVLDDGTLLTPEWLSSLRVPTTGRRTLVLNACSVANAQIRGGTSRIGVAQSMVGANQLVIGHLWPVHWTVGLAFGLALASELPAAPPEGAFFAAVSLMRDPVEMIARLEATYGADNGAIQRLQRAGEDFANLMAWGGPAILT